jgi:hypothetical protein
MKVSKTAFDQLNKYFITILATTTDIDPTLIIGTGKYTLEKNAPFIIIFSGDNDLFGDIDSLLPSNGFSDLEGINSDSTFPESLFLF